MNYASKMFWRLLSISFKGFTPKCLGMEPIFQLVINTLYAIDKKVISSPIFPIKYPAYSATLKLTCVDCKSDASVSRLFENLSFIPMSTNINETPKYRKLFV